MSNWRRGGHVPTESELIHAAAGGDRGAFDELAAPHREWVRLHCYRMLGSFHDAEDAVQETLVKAWRNLGRFEGRSLFGTWLHRIATTTCLNLVRRRPRIVVPDEYADRHRPAAADVAWLEPYPNIHLPVPSDEDPQARIEAKEATRLAFVATMQLLPARQRAVLLLRDVLKWRAAEVAEALDTTVPAVHSALQRARARLAEHKTWDEATPEVEAAVDEVVPLGSTRHRRASRPADRRRINGDATRSDVVLGSGRDRGVLRQGACRRDDRRHPAGEDRGERAARCGRVHARSRWRAPRVRRDGVRSIRHPDPVYHRVPGPTPLIRLRAPGDAFSLGPMSLAPPRRVQPIGTARDLFGGRQSWEVHSRPSTSSRARPIAGTRTASEDSSRTTSGSWVR